jgi:hypothetical protein
MIIGSRVLTLRTGSQEIKIPIYIHAPEEKGTSSWSCRYEVGWPDKKSEKDAWGVDAIQALISALQMIGVEIYTSSFHKAGALYLDVPGKGYGFPVTGGIRDLLQGDDAKYL